MQQVGSFYTRINHEIGELHVYAHLQVLVCILYTNEIYFGTANVRGVAGELYMFGSSTT